MKLPPYVNADVGQFLIGFARGADDSGNPWGERTRVAEHLVTDLRMKSVWLTLAGELEDASQIQEFFMGALSSNENYAVLREACRQLERRARRVANATMNLQAEFRELEALWSGEFEVLKGEFLHRNFFEHGELADLYGLPDLLWETMPTDPKVAEIWEYLRDEICTPCIDLRDEPIDYDKINDLETRDNNLGSGLSFPPSQRYMAEHEERQHYAWRFAPTFINMLQKIEKSMASLNGKELIHHYDIAVVIDKRKGSRRDFVRNFVLNLVLDEDIQISGAIISAIAVSSSVILQLGPDEEVTTDDVRQVHREIVEGLEHGPDG